jgi:hypothetical protein
MPLWDSAKGDVPYNFLPNTTATQFGSGTSAMPEEGNIYRLVSGTGVQPASTGGDIVLAVFSIPANSFDVSGRGINIIAQGSLGANANTKTVKLFFNPTTAVVGSAVSGGTAIATTGAVTTNGGGFAVEANVFKYGVAGSNTQLAIHQAAQTGATVSALLAPQNTTAVESAPILVAVTGNAATAVGDISLSFVEINAMN